jgi:hypothetical protein
MNCPFCGHYNRRGCVDCGDFCENCGGLLQVDGFIPHPGTTEPNRGTWPGPEDDEE